MSNTKCIQPAYAYICNIIKEEIMNLKRNGGAHGDVEVENRGVKMQIYYSHIKLLITIKYIYL